MRLKSVHIQNFRCFEDLTLEFEKDLTVFVATNGGGKTTITDAIAAGFVPIVQALAGSPPDLLSPRGCSEGGWQWWGKSPVDNLSFGRRK